MTNQATSAAFKTRRTMAAEVTVPLGIGQSAC